MNIKHIIYTASLFLSLALNAQENTDVKSIKIKREELYTKAAFDETEYKVIAFDKYGNPHEKAIKSFVISFNDNGNLMQAKVIGNVFPDKTIKYLTKKRINSTKICLEKIVAENPDGHNEQLPNLCEIVIFPDCKKVKH